MNGRLTGDSRTYYRVQGATKGVPFLHEFPLTEKGWVGAVKALAHNKNIKNYRKLIARRKLLEKFNGTN